MKSFKMGGIHPAECKFSAGKKTEVISLPKQVVIPLRHYSGKPSIPEVAKGDIVKVGQLIGRANGFVSANVHSSVSGKVVKIDNALDAFGYKNPAVFIDVIGDDWLETIDLTPKVKRVCELEPPEIIKKIAESGIVGLGGATFPTHVKLSIPAGKKAEVLIINGAECEPYLTCDHQLMLEKGEEIVIGITILMKAIQVSRAIIGIEINKPDAILNLEKWAKTVEGVEVVPLKVKYPQGSEKQLIQALTGREVPSGGLPIDVGAIVQNVATTFAVYEAVQKNKPLIERVITVTGKSVAEPGNYWVRVGTPLSHVVEKTGGMPEDTGKIVAGGPMMGRALPSLDISVAKGTAAVLFIPSSDSERGKVQNCIRCAKCVFHCPMGLEPYLLMNKSEKGLWEDVEQNRVMDCIECGSCNYVCPSNRPLVDYIRYGKSMVGNLISSRKTQQL
jgi:electron transport complex protein RnfC